MSKLADHLQSQTATVRPLISEMTPPDDPVQWAMNMFRQNQPEAAVQVTESAETGEARVRQLDEREAATHDRFQQGILDGSPVHGRLALIDYCTGDGTLRDNADWTWSTFDSQFLAALNQRHPLGFYAKAMLWTSCGDHVYEAHCDIADGFLMHLCGRKKVRVWPVPEKFRKLAIFNHSDFNGRMESEPQDFDLTPGQVLFIPAGAMHEVVAEGSQPCVSVSYHMGSPHPLMTLCVQLNKLVRGGGDIVLPPNMRAKDKFNIYFFEPTRFLSGTGKAMPPELATPLLLVLRSGMINQAFMRQLLDYWWQIATSDPVYLGPYPD